MTKALIYMGGNTKPIEVDVKTIERYGPYNVIIEATNNTIYETHSSNVLFITKKEEE